MITADFTLNNNCGRIRCAPHWSRTPQTSAALQDGELWFVYAGQGSMQTHMGDVALRPGFAILMRPGGRYDAQQDNNHPLHVCWMHYRVSPHNGAADAPWYSSHYDHMGVCHDWEAIDHALQRSIHHQHAGNHPLAHTWFMAALHDITNQLTDKTEYTDEKTIKITELVASVRVRATLPSVNDMAHDCHWSLPHFSREFKRVTGISPVTFLIDERIKRACQWLRESHTPLQHIATALGYRDVFFFSRQFKQRMGVSPKAYRMGSVDENTKDL